jgi:hypothetical protein
MTNAFRLNDCVSRPRSAASANCEAVRFYGRQLHVALSKAAEYLRDRERNEGYAPSIVALHDEFSWEDSDADIAWELTLILREDRGVLR